MNRRDWMKSAAVAAGAAALPLESIALPQAGIGGRAKIETEIKRLNLRHTWTTTMASDDFRDVIMVRYARDGVTGYGEGAPIIRYKENAVNAQKAIDSVRDLLESANPWEFDKLMIEFNRRVPGEHAAKAAIDIAVMDWVGKKLNVPIYRYLGLDAKDAPVTTFTIGMDKPEVVKQKTLEAAPYPVLKVKVGPNVPDEQMIDTIRSITDKPLRVDANEGWTNKEDVVRKIEWLEKKNVEFMEQPLPASVPLEDIRWIRERVSMPLIADEACTEAKAIPTLLQVYDGVNVKLDKAGGIMESYRWIKMARAYGKKVMLGCMISSSCTCTAAAHLSPLVDYADLDGPLLISNDPYRGVQYDKAKLILPDKPGLGLTIA
jgi:L-alanine-DL-glutamate epimerase-like enolase superfamily enzyme